MNPRPHGGWFAAPALVLAAACAHPPPPPPAPPAPPDAALVAGARQTLEQALASRKAANVTRLFDPALADARSWATQVVPRATEPVEVRLTPAAVDGDQIVARLQLHATKMRGIDGFAAWNGTLAVVPDAQTGWRFTQAPPAILQQVRTDSWKQDIAFLRTELPRRHVNAFAEARRQQFEGALAALEGALPRLDEHQIQVGLMSAVALLGDPHTRLRASFQTVGIELEWFADGVFVTRAARPHTELARTRLLRVGTVPVEHAAVRVRSVFATDNDSAVYHLAPWYLAQPEVLHAVGLAGRPEAAFYAFQRADGHEINLELALPEAGQSLRWPERLSPTLRERQPERPFWFQRLTRGKALYLKYNRCEDAEGFRTLTDKFLAILDRGGIERVVIDLRDNEGGDSSVAEPLLVALAERRARPGRTRFEVLGLIGRRTFSSGMWTAIHLRKRLGATLIGEPTSGKPNGPGEVQTVALPVSGLELQYSTRTWLRDPDAGNMPSLLPELTVVPKAADHFARKDVVLDAALGWKRAPTTPAPGPTRPTAEVTVTASR